MSCRLSALGLTLALLLAGCGDSSASRKVALDACSSLRAQGTFTLLVSAADKPTIEFDGAKSAVAAVDVQATDGQINLIAPLPGNLVVRIFCPGLRRVELLGAVQGRQVTAGAIGQYEKIATYGDSHFSAQRVTANDLDLRASGRAKIVIEHLSAETVQTLMSGNGVVTLAGDAAQLRAEVAGTAVLAASELTAQSVNLRARGRSRAAVFATAHLDAQLRDTAAVVYSGTPDLRIDRQDQATLQHD